MLSLIVAATLAAEPSPLDARVEIQLIPMVAQANILRSEHLGSGGRLTVRLNRYLGGYVGGGGNWHSSPSKEGDLLSDRNFRLRGDSPPTEVLSTWQLVLGLESIPLSGTFRFASLPGGEFGLAVRAGLGVTGARIRLKPLTVRHDGTQSAATYGDAGVRLAGEFGLGFRFSLGAFALHLGPRLSIWSDELTRVNGCNIDDLRAMDMQVRGGLNPADASVSGTCTGFAHSNDIPLAMNELRSPTRTLVINLAAELGLSWSF